MSEKVEFMKEAEEIREIARNIVGRAERYEDDIVFLAGAYLGLFDLYEATEEVERDGLLIRFDDDQEVKL